MWEVERGQCVRVIQGYTASLLDLEASSSKRCGRIDPMNPSSFLGLPRLGPVSRKLL